MKTKPIKKKRVAARVQIAQSMRQASALLGVPKSEIQRAKRDGAPGFMRSGRLDLAKLRPWLKANPAPGTELHPELLGVEMTGLEQQFDAVVEVEGAAFAQVRAAQNRGDAAALEALTAAYGRACRDRQRTEAFIREERVRRGELMTLDEHKRQLTRLWIPAVTLMRKLPRTTAAKVNPSDEVQAEKVLATAIEDVIAEMRRSLNAEPDSAWYIDVAVAAMLREEGGRQKLLALLDETKARLTCGDLAPESSAAAKKPSGPKTGLKTS